MEQEILERAKEYYYNHLELCPIMYGFMWDQASKTYQDIFIALAALDLADEAMNSEL